MPIISFLKITQRYLIVLLALQITLLNLNAQQLSITGKISGPDGFPLPGVNVMIQGTITGTVTNLNGEFNLQVPSSDAVLHISFIGFKTIDLPINGQTQLNIVLEEDIAGLEEVIVVGYGTQKKVNLSGAVDQVSSEDFQSRPIANISQGLQGLVPNLNIDFVSGEPGQSSEINIRGITSINVGEPLILIDGISAEPYELNRIPPEDVENISVLKDASSAAIYGARAAFGVILVTTKKGSGDRTTVNYVSNYSFSKPTILPEKITDPYIYMRVLETATNNTPWDNVDYTDEQYLWAKQRSDDPSVEAVRLNPFDETAWEYMGNKDWTKHYLDDYAYSQKQHLSISGKPGKIGYYLSGGYDSQNGVVKIADDKFDRYNMKSNVNYEVTDWLSVGNNTVLTSTNRVKPNYLSIWDIYNLFPTDWDKNPDGTWANTEAGRMGAKLSEGGDYTDKYNSFLTTFNMESRFFKGLLKINADATFRRENDDVFYDTRKYKIGYGPEDIREEGSGTAYRNISFDRYTGFNIYATLNKSFGRSTVSALLGFNQEESRYEWLYAYRNKVISSSLPTVALATGETYVSESIEEWAIRGAFFRLNYIFDDKYIIEFNGRYDGSSKFPRDNRFGFFPSASAAWRIDKEAFMNESGLLSTLKPRISYGSLGNQFVSPYDYISTMDASQAWLLIGNSRPMMVSTPQLVSPNYTWEKVLSYNTGIDIGFFNDRLLTNFDYYTRNTIGMLTQGKDLPDVLGAGEPNENAADLSTKGWELSVTYKFRTSVANKPLALNTKVILSDSRSTITKFDNPNKNLIQYYEGMELGEIWGLTSDGLFETAEQIAALDETSIIPWGALSIVPGWPRYKDFDQSNTIETGLTVDDPKDLSIIGNSTPRYRYGFNFDGVWNGFDFRVFFQGIGKRDYYPLDYLYWGFYQQPYAGGYEHLLDFYRPTASSEVDMAKHSQAYIDAGLAEANLDAYYPILQAWLADRNLGERIDEAKGLAIPQTRYLLNAAYLRLKNITLGYTLPSDLTKRMRISQIRVYVSGENIFEWSEVKKYYDPEAITDAVKLNPSESTDRYKGKGYAYPFQRYYSFGLNVTF